MSIRTRKLVGAVALIIRAGGDEHEVAPQDADLGCTKAPDTLHA